MKIFLKGGKTNWKYILIVLIFAIIVGGGILGWIKMQEVPPPEFPEITKLPDVEQPEEKDESKISDEDIAKIINEILPEDCNKEDAQYYIQDLNGNEKKEIIIITFGLGPFPEKEEKCYTAEGIEVPCREIEWGCLEIASLEKEGNYIKIGELKTKDIFKNATMVPTIINFEDVDDDNQKEIFLSGRGIAHNDFTEGILDIDFEGQKLDWLKLKDEKENVRNAIFWRGRGALGGSYWDLEDFDKDEKKEIVEIEDWISFEKPKDFKIAKIKQLEDGSWKRCSVKAYEWDGSFFSYSEELSRTILELKCED